MTNTTDLSTDSPRRFSWPFIGRRVGLRAVGALAFWWLVLEVLDFFKVLPWIADYRLPGLSAFVGLVVLVTLGELCMFLRTQGVRLSGEIRKKDGQLAEHQAALETARQQDVTSALVSEMQQAFNNQRWKEVIRIGSALSRPLWITGRYSLRIQLGKLVESAASYDRNPSAQAAALIDDLGWTKAALGRFDEARSSIEHGLKLAGESGQHYLVSKGNRHLAGIATKLSRLEDAHAFLVRARAAALAVDDPRLKSELEASFCYSEAVQQRKQSLYPEALKNFEEAQRLFSVLGDQDRSVKCFGSMGDIYLLTQNIPAAKDSYRTGLVVARQVSRKDAELRCLRGLADTAFAEGIVTEAIPFLTEAAQIAGQIGDADLASELTQRAAKVGGAKG